MCSQERESVILCVSWSHTIVITLEIGHVFDRASVSLKVSLSVTHRNQLIVYSMQKEAWHSALSSLLNWIESV